MYWIDEPRERVKWRIPVEAEDHEPAVEPSAEPENPVVEEIPPKPEPETVPDELDLLDRLKRVQADFSNYRKRTLKSGDEKRADGENSVIEALLPVLDHFEAGIKAAESTTDDATLKGFSLIYNELCHVLKQFGVERLETIGRPFDPQVHEAVAVEPSDEYGVDEIIRETKRGYVRGEKLIRPASVVVSTGNRFSEGGVR